MTFGWLLHCGSTTLPVVEANITAAQLVVGLRAMPD